MRYEIMILTYNRKGIVARCLKSLMPTLLRPEVSWSVLDNASSDGTSEWLMNVKTSLDDPSFKLYLGAENLGVSGGRDLLLRQAEPDADIWVFLDSDVIAQDNDWLDRLTACLMSDEDVGIVGPGGHWVTVDDDNQWEWFEPTPPGYSGAVDVVSGFCQAFKTEAMEGFEMDLNFGRYWLEDSWTCLWLREHGWETLCTGEIGIRHLYANSAQDDTGPQKMAYLASLYQGRRLIRAERSAA